jgi:hypothetical protein
MEIAPPQNSPVVPTASLFGFTLGVWRLQLVG